MMRVRMKTGVGIGLILVILLVLMAGNAYLAKPKNTMTIHTVTYENSAVGLVYTLYDSEQDLKITTPFYELAAAPGADKSYLSSAITCSISRTDKGQDEFRLGPDGKRIPVKIYRGVKATYKTDGAVYELQLENGDRIEACDVIRWNPHRLGKPQFINQ